MGLCKCPKRKTTSHFCFQHCVNVCEHCIINNHTTCVVKSYTTWLKEASSVSSSSVSASALCAVCQKQLMLTPKETDHSTTNFSDSKSNPKNSIRLLCYHVVHVHCLSIYVKKQLKEGNILKCPSCTRSLWFQNNESDLYNTKEIDYNELPPVALTLYKHLLNHGEWWGQSLITNEKVEDIEKYFLQEDKNICDSETQEVESQPILEKDHQLNVISNITSPLKIPQTAVLPSNTNPPIYHRHFNSNNYGIDTESTQQEQRHSLVNMTNLQSSDLSNRYTIPYSTPLLTNVDNNFKENEDPSGKKRPKKFKNQSWNLGYQLFQMPCSPPRSDNNTNMKLIIVIVLCIITIVFLLVVITSLTRSDNEPFDSNNVDYGGNSDTVTNLNSYNSVL